MRDETPKTINELKILANVEGVSLAHLGFHIGLDMESEGTTCIVRDGNGTYSVYENVTDGERNVLYEGEDEEEAVATIYDRIVPVARRAGTPIGNRRRGSLFDEEDDSGSQGRDGEEGEPDEVVEKVLLAIRIPRILLLGVPMLLMVVIIWWLLGFLGI